ncbi:MAG: hypothetical protein HY855_21390 [Burkholderiales bacterium]|nr:hypothetical protein [Burkholderiales bacterium]
MMNRLQRLLAILGVALVLSSCAGPQIFHPQLSALDKGLSQAQVLARLGLPPLSTHAAAAGGRAFVFDRYRMNNGVHADTYLLAYERDRLVFWGYVSEFRRQPDNDLSQALTMALREAAAAAKP